MIGVVLCGGESRRMGVDKGLIAGQKGNWALLAYKKLRDLHFPVVVSVNQHQRNTYKTFFESDLLVADNTELSVQGPLLGLLSVHLQYPKDDLFVLACDMVVMETPLLSQLLERFSRGEGFGCLVYSLDREPEPLCGIYTAKALAKILTLVQSHALPKYSMKYVIEISNAFLVPVDNGYNFYFQNFNRQEDRLNLD